MSAAMGIALAVLTLGSCWVSYALGRESMWNELKDRWKRRGRDEKWENYEDFD